MAINNNAFFDRYKQKLNEKRASLRGYSIITIAEQMGYTIDQRNKVYSLKEHDSVTFDLKNNTFTRWATGAHGDALAFIYEFENDALGFKDAVLGNKKELTFYKKMNVYLDYLMVQAKEHPEYLDQSFNQVSYSFDNTNRRLELPKVSDNFKNVYAYLTKTRMIDPDIVNEFHNNKWILQGDKYKECLFISYEGDHPKCAVSRVSNTYTKMRPRLLSGSDASYGFRVDNQKDTLFVFEAVIDMMSFMTLEKDNLNLKRYDYLSLNGVSHTKAVVRYLDEHPQISDVFLCLDNDTAGLTAGEMIRDIIHKRYKDRVVVSEDGLSTKGIKVSTPFNTNQFTNEEVKDWNEALVSVMNDEGSSKVFSR